MVNAWFKNEESGGCNSIKMALFKQPTTKFMKVRCNCKNEQIIFGKCATVVNCLVCGKPLAHPVGGKSQIEARVLEVLD